MSEPAEHKPLSAERWAEIRNIAGIDSDPHTYQQTVTLALRDVIGELHWTQDTLAAHLALESADAAAGSYAGRAEEAEAEVRRLRQRIANLIAAWRQGNTRRAGLPRIADDTTGDEAYASATLDLTFDEIRARVAGHDAATARAEQAEAALAELEKRLGKTDVEWNVRWPDGVIPTTPLDAPNAHMKAALYRSTQLVSRLVGEWQTADMTDDDATPRTALERATDEQDVQPVRSVAPEDDIDIDVVIAQNHADAMRDWGIADE